MRTVVLSEIADQVRGVSYGKTDVVDRPLDGYLPVIRANNITDEGLELSNLVFVRSEKVGERQKIRSGDIVIAASSGSISVVGKAAQSLTDLEAGFGAFCKVVRPSGRVDHRYLGHFFRTPAYRQKMSALAAGANINNLKNEHIDDLEIPVPPLEEQKRIADILDQADALRRKRQRALDRLGQLGQAIFIEMFGDPIASGLTSLADVLTAASNGMNVEQNNTGLGVPVTRIETIWNGTIDYSRVRWTNVDAKSAERFFLRDGDILFSHINSPEHIGKTALYRGSPKHLLHGINLLRLQPDRTKISPIWLLHLLKSRSVRAYFRNRCKKAVNQASLNQGDLAALHFVVPDILEQRAFSARVVQIWEHAPILENAVRRQSELFASLQYHAFQGEL
jgi:type I restriction enzyme S subunit